MFIQDEISLTENLTATLGIRYDSFKRDVHFDPVSPGASSTDLSGDTDAFTPRFALSWQSNVGNVYFSYGQGFNSNFGPVFEWNPANYARGENKPTTIDSFEIGWKTELLDQRLQLELAAYQTYQKNRRSIISNPAADDDWTQPSNLVTCGQQYETQGVEFSLFYLPAPDIQLSLTASHVNPEWEEYIINNWGTEFDLSGTTPVGVAENTFYFSYDQRVTPWLELRAVYEFYDDYYFYFGDRTAPTYAMPGPEREFRATLDIRW